VRVEEGEALEVRDELEVRDGVGEREELRGMETREVLEGRGEGESLPTPEAGEARPDGVRARGGLGEAWCVGEGERVGARGEAVD